MVKFLMKLSVSRSSPKVSAVFKYYLTHSSFSLKLLTKINNNKNFT